MGEKQSRVLHGSGPWSVLKAAALPCSYITNTGVKFLVVVDDPVVRDDEMKGLMEQLHSAFVDAVSNPFYTPGQPLTSPGFEKRIQLLIKRVKT